MRPICILASILGWLPQTAAAQCVHSVGGQHVTCGNLTESVVRSGNVVTWNVQLPDRAPLRVTTTSSTPTALVLRTDKGLFWLTGETPDLLEHRLVPVVAQARGSITGDRVDTEVRFSDRADYVLVVLHPATLRPGEWGWKAGGSDSVQAIAARSQLGDDLQVSEPVDLGQGANQPTYDPDELIPALGDICADRLMDDQQKERSRTGAH